MALDQVVSLVCWFVLLLVIWLLFGVYVLVPGHLPFDRPGHRGWAVRVAGLGILALTDWNAWQWVREEPSWARFHGLHRWVVLASWLMGTIGWPTIAYLSALRRWWERQATGGLQAQKPR